MSKKLSVMLTGGDGFIGRNVREFFKDNYTLLAPTHSELELLNTSAVDKYFKKHRPDVVVHAANLGGTRKQVNLSGVTYSNLRIFFNLVNVHRYYGRMIVLGSGAEYDKNGEICNVREEEFGKRVPADEYGFYKYVCSKYAEEAGFITHLRLFAVYGKYEDYELRFISNAICKALLGLPITIKQNVKFDYLYVSDLVNLLDFIINKTPPEIFYNVGGRHIDLVSIASKVVGIVGKTVPVKIDQLGWGKEYTADSQKFRKEYPEFELTDFDQSLRELVAFYKEKIIAPNFDKRVFLTDI